MDPPFGTLRPLPYWLFSHGVWTGFQFFWAERSIVLEAEGWGGTTAGRFLPHGFSKQEPLQHGSMQCLGLQAFTRMLWTPVYCVHRPFILGVAWL